MLTGYPTVFGYHSGFLLLGLQAIPSVVGDECVEVLIVCLHIHHMGEALGAKSSLPPYLIWALFLFAEPDGVHPYFRLQIAIRLTFAATRATIAFRFVD